MPLMPFVTNFPRRSRPRGLGYAGMDGVAGALSGMGTWVVDAEYGLGPRFREGFNRPYPQEALPTRWPRAQAARVLGPSASVNVVARPYAATRLPTTRYPVRMAPVTAPGARLRNPGVAGYGFFLPEGAEAVGMALKETSVWGSAVAGVAVGMGGKLAGLTGRSRNVTGWLSLGAFALAGINYARHYIAISNELKTRGAAAVGPATVKGALENAKEVIANPQAATEKDMRGTLAQYACYENARRAQASEGWWFRITGNTVRDPLKDCGMTKEQAAIIKAAFEKISRADRRRLGGNVYKPGGSLEDLG